MKQLKINVILTAFLAVIFASCSNDVETKINRDQFIGVYMVQESCDYTGDTYTDTYNIEITASATGDNVILIDNLYDWWEICEATVGVNSFTIAPQLLDGIVFEGTGSIKNNILSIELDLTSGDDFVGCTLTCEKM